MVWFFHTVILLHCVIYAKVLSYFEGAYFCLFHSFYLLGSQYLILFAPLGSRVLLVFYFILSISSITIEVVIETILFQFHFFCCILGYQTTIRAIIYFILFLDHLSLTRIIFLLCILPPPQFCSPRLVNHEKYWSFGYLVDILKNIFLFFLDTLVIITDYPVWYHVPYEALGNYGVSDSFLGLLPTLSSFWDC